MSPARAQTRTNRSGDKRTNHEATAPPYSDIQMDAKTFMLQLDVKELIESECD